MQRFLRYLEDSRITVVTVPRLDLNSLHRENLRELSRLFRHATDRVIGQTVILDVTPVTAAGASFLTEVHSLAAALAEVQVELVIVGDPAGLFLLAGWQHRFRLYDSLPTAISECTNSCQLAG